MARRCANGETVQAPCGAGRRLRARIMTPTAPKPRIIIAQLAGSGTPATGGTRLDVAVTKDDEPGLKLLTR